MKIDKKKLIIFAVMCVVSFIVVFASLSLMRPKSRQTEMTDIDKDNLLTVRVQTLKPQDLDDIVSIVGVLAPERSVSEPVEESGKVEDVLFEKGDYVTAGDVLLRIESDSYRFRYEQAKALYEKSESDFNRWKKLKETGSVAENVLDEKRTDMQSAKWSYELAKLALDKCVVKASISGVIQDKFVEKGEFVSPGMVVAEIKDLNILKLEVNIPEKDIFSIKQGDVLKFTVDALDNQEFSAKIVFVAPDSDRRSNTFRVELDYDNSAGILKPGVFVRLKLKRKEFKDAIVVPLSSLVVEKGYYIAYTVSDGEVIRNVVRLKQIVDSKAVISSGLEIGDRLIVKGQRLVSDGTLVEIVEEELNNKE